MLSLFLLSILCSLWITNGQMVTDRRFIQEATGPSIVCGGSSVIFNCTVGFVVSGTNVTVNAQWRRDGVVITDSTPGHTLIRTQHGDSPRITAVMVDSTTLSDNGIIYTCTADDTPDNFTSNVTLNVTGPPSPIASITASDTSCLTTNVIVSWDPSTSDPVCEPLSYNVMISPDGMMMMINDTTYNFTTLTPGTTYTVTVAANNMAGVGQSNMTMFYIITMSEALPSGVTDLELMSMFDSSTNATKVIVTWTNATSPYCGGVSYYIVQLSLKSMMVDRRNVTDLSSLTVTFRNLRNNTNYDVAVTAGNSVGVGMTITKSINTPIRSQSVSPGAIAGIVIGGTVGVGGVSGVTFCFVWFCLCRTPKKSGRQKSLVQPGLDLEMNKEDKSDLCDSVKNRTEDAKETTAGATQQSLYSYARTGPINVVMPDGKP